MTQSKHHHFFHRAPVFCSACLCLTYFVHSETGLWSLVQFPSIHLFCFIIYVYLPNGICHRPHQSWCLWSSSRFTSTNYMSLWSPLEKSPVDRTSDHWVTLDLSAHVFPAVPPSGLPLSVSLYIFVLFFVVLSWPGLTSVFYLCFLTLYTHTTDIFSHASPVSQDITWQHTIYVQSQCGN